MPPNTEPPDDHRAVDVFLTHMTGEKHDERHKNMDYRANVKETAYSRKVKADPKAIANFDSLPRPKAPPGRSS